MGLGDRDGTGKAGEEGTLLSSQGRPWSGFLLFRGSKTALTRQVTMEQMNQQLR